MFSTVIYFYESFSNVVLITFSSLIIIELLNVYSQVNVIKLMMVMSSLLTLVVYIFTILALKNYFDFSYITPTFGQKILMVTFASWFPLYFIQFLMTRCNPTE